MKNIKLNGILRILTLILAFGSTGAAAQERVTMTPERMHRLRISKSPQQ